MTWWTDLWLNEGFATWVGNFAIDNFFKEWDIWTQFVNQYTNRALQVRQKSPRTTKEPYFSGGANGKRGSPAKRQMWRAKAPCYHAGAAARLIPKSETRNPKP